MMTHGQARQAQRRSGVRLLPPMSKRCAFSSVAEPIRADTFVKGVTPLMAAAGLGWTGNQHRTVPNSWLAAAKLSLELGNDINARDIFSYTAIHAAAYRGDDELVKFLVAKGARLDTVTIFGTNVTDMANGFVAFGSLPQEHAETVKLLVGLGAPPPTPGDRAYCTAADLTCPVVAASR